MIFGIGTDIRRSTASATRSRVTAIASRNASSGPTRWRSIDAAARAASRAAAGCAHTFLATRFAAKEAISKALGLGMRMPMRWRAAQILKERCGKPRVAPRRAGPWMAERSLVAHVTLTDDADYAVAFAVVERVER